MTEKESILNRIKKLMAMTVERGATPEEAATAAAKIQAILFEHNLGIAEAEAHDPRQAKEGYQNISWDVPFGSAPAIRWAKTLLHYIARSNFCKILVGEDRTCFIVGKPSNVEVVSYMGEAIGRQIHKMCHDQMRRELGSTAKYSYYNAYCLGAVATVNERLEAMAAQQHQVSAASTAMVACSKGELIEAARKFYPKTGKSRGSEVRDGGAYGQGRTDGHKVGIHRGVGSGGGGKTLQIGRQS